MVVGPMVVSYAVRVEEAYVVSCGSDERIDQSNEWAMSFAILTCISFEKTGFLAML